MRYVIYGAGAIGGIIGGRLFEQGHDVVLIARGEHLAALQHDGLTLESPRGTATLKVRSVGHPSEMEPNADDVVFLAMKTQDTARALVDLVSAGGREAAIFCAQNGVESERLALRSFERVYGVMVFMPGTYLEPGVVQSHGAPVDGILHVGRYPRGTDELAKAVARDLEGANMSAPVVEDIMRWKYAKLLGNVNNALQAAVGLEAGQDARDLYGKLREEAIACYEAAGIEWATTEEMTESRGEFKLAPVGDGRRAGGSSWQSLERGAGSIETDFLNGEIVLLGALHGVATPTHRLVQRVANELARAGKPPGSITVEELREQLAAEV